MQEYINEYQNINGEFASIISKSLEADNLQVHAKAASFMDDFQQWIELLSDSYEVILYKEALSEYRSMLLFWCMGLYKHDVGVKTINKFNPIPYSTLKNSYFVVYRRGLGNI